MMNSTDSLKVVILGEGRVGKTSVTQRFCHNQFDADQQSTINAAYLEKQIDLGNGKSATLSIWDTAGQEKFHAMMPMYYREALGAVLVYDVTDKESFIRVEKWMEELRSLGGKDLVIVIAGNKCDMKHQMQISQQESEAYATQKGAKHFLTSAKSNFGIDAMFLHLTKGILAARPPARDGKKKGSSLYIKEKSKKEQQSTEKIDKSGCC